MDYKGEYKERKENGRKEKERKLSRMTMSTINEEGDSKRRQSTKKEIVKKGDNRGRRRVIEIGDRVKRIVSKRVWRRRDSAPEERRRISGKHWNKGRDEQKDNQRDRLSDIASVAI